MQSGCLFLLLSQQKTAGKSVEWFIGQMVNFGDLMSLYTVILSHKCIKISYIMGQFTTSFCNPLHWFSLLAVSLCKVSLLIITNLFSVYCSQLISDWIILKAVSSNLTARNLCFVFKYIVMNMGSCKHH